MPTPPVPHRLRRRLWLAAPRRLALLLLLVGAGAAGPATTAGCYGRGRSAAAPTARTTLRVRNQNFLDMNIYLFNSGSRYRLGTVTGNSTAVLTIPPSFVQAGAPLRFLADPIGGRGTPVTDQVIVSPGDEVTLIVPPS